MGKRTSTRVAVNTERTVVNVENGPECHALGALAENMDNARIAQAWTRVVEIARMVEAETGVQMVTGNGRIRCTNGKFFPRGKGLSSRTGMADLGHDHADELDGPFCAFCNLYPQEGRDNGTSGLGRIEFAPEFPREAWDRAARAHAFSTDAAKPLPLARRKRMVA